MNYEISFRDKNQYVGDLWISHPCDAADPIKEVCGVYPSKWDGAKCADLAGPLHEAAGLLLYNVSLRDCYPEADIITAAMFLAHVAENCAEHPTATVEVDCG